MVTVGSESVIGAIVVPPIAHAAHYLPSLAVFVVPVALLVVWRIWADRNRARSSDQDLQNRY